MPGSSRPGAVVVAAGASSRMGSPKALLPWGGVPLAEAHVRALAPWSSGTVVVLGAGFAEIGAHLPGLWIVENAVWATSGMIGSIAAGLRALPPGPAWVVPVDTAPVAPDVAGALLAAGGPAVPVDPAGNLGHPVLLDAATVAEILRAPPAGGLRAILGSARRVPVGADVAADFDTPGEYARMIADGAATPAPGARTGAQRREAT